MRLDHAETETLLGERIPFSLLDDFAEVVHLEISARCQLRCSYCYAGDKTGEELSTARWKAIIDDLAGYGALQLTFGGGEPTLRDDLGELALYVRQCGLNLCMTTNGLTLGELDPCLLRLFNQINVSYHGDEGVLRQAAKHLAEHGVPLGVNFLATEEYLDRLGQVVQIAHPLGAELLMLTAKGVEGAPPPERVMAEARALHRQGVRVAVDGLTCAAALPEFCMQKERFCTVSALGDVLPCSFIRTPLGNLLEQPFADIWRSRGEPVPCPFV